MSSAEPLAVVSGGVSTPSNAARRLALLLRWRSASSVRVTTPLPWHRRQGARPTTSLGGRGILLAVAMGLDALRAGRRQRLDDLAAGRAAIARRGP